MKRITETDIQIHDLKWEIENREQKEKELVRELNKARIDNRKLAQENRELKRQNQSMSSTIISHQRRQQGIFNDLRQLQGLVDDIFLRE